MNTISNDICPSVLLYGTPQEIEDALRPNTPEEEVALAEMDAHYKELDSPEGHAWTARQEAKYADIERRIQAALTKTE